MAGRIGRLKSRTGCDTCKLRRIRCTEEHPHCSKCTKTGRRCTYTSPLLRHQPNLSIKSLNIPIGASSNLTSRERHYFEYYFHHVAPLLSGSLDHPFWGMYVLQLCRTEPAIWDGLISLGALFERPPIAEQANPTALLHAPAVVRHEYHHDALAWYSRSLASMRQRINRRSADVDVVLAGTIIYIAIEFLQANYKAVMELYTRGMQLMAGHCAAESGLKSAVRAMFRRLRTQVLIFGGSSMGDEEVDQPTLNEVFESIDEARNALFEMISDMKQLLLAIKSYRLQTGSAYIPSSHPLTIRQTQLEQQLHHWYRLFKSPPCTQAGDGDTTTQILLMNHTAILLETQACLSASETAYDLQKDAFGKMLEYADSIFSFPSSPSPTKPSGKRSPPFSFEPSTFLPLFITALKCRAPDTRRKALRLLSGTDDASALNPGVQGMFLCRPAAQLVAVIVGLEEGSYPPPPPPSFSSYKPLNGSRTVLDYILAQNGCVPRDEDRICDFWVSSHSGPEAEDEILSPQHRHSNERNSKENGSNESWLHYRQYTCLPLPLARRGNEDTSEKKMGYVTRKIRLPDNI